MLNIQRDGADVVIAPQTGIAQVRVRLKSGGVWPSDSGQAVSLAHPLRLRVDADAGARLEYEHAPGLWAYGGEL